MKLVGLVIESVGDWLIGASLAGNMGMIDERGAA